MTTATEPAALTIELIPIDSVTPFPKNPHKGDVDGVATSLARYGQWRQILIQRSTGFICAGNTTWKAAKKLGWTTINATFLDVDDVTAKAILLADNRWAQRGEDDRTSIAEFLKEITDAGGWTDAIGYTARQVDQFLATLRPKDPDAIIAERPTSVKPGDVFRLGDHRLICGDALTPETITALMGGKRADCVFTSPPYAVGVDYGTYQDTLPNLRALLVRAAAAWNDVVRPGGFAVLNFNDLANGREAAGTPGICEYPMALEYWPVFRAAGWVLWSRRIWAKPVARTNSPWAIQSNRAASNFEHVWTWKAPGDVAVKRIDGEFASQNGWFDSTSIEGVGVGKEDHGAGMPTGVAARMLAIHSNRDGIVHEPFSGTGTTLIAAEQLGRRCFAAEIEPRYVQMTIDRWEQYTGRAAVQL